MKLQKKIPLTIILPIQNTYKLILIPKKDKRFKLKDHKDNDKNIR